MDAQGSPPLRTAVPTLPSGLTPWPAELAAEYRAAGLWRGQTLGALLRELAAEHGPRIALVVPATSG